MSDELVTWLRARYDDDERVAKACTWPSETVERVLADPVHYAWQPNDISPTRAAHIKRWQSDRVLREVEAKRRILDMCAGWIAEPRVEDWEIDRAEELCLQNDAGPTLLRLLALPYADRPGYREEWRP